MAVREEARGGLCYTADTDRLRRSECRWYESISRRSRRTDSASNRRLGSPGLVALCLSRHVRPDFAFSVLSCRFGSVFFEELSVVVADGTDPRTPVECPFDESTVEPSVAGEFGFAEVPRVPQHRHHRAVFFSVDE
ncbi:hypothetical protein HFX_6233 (plasmid) [Haloferax mediterranei ATCC 33500]|uniref:Uncharacterized protein n=1 Tax=Haloferax mediterranei (strain ATCC 33500 / DSM 1411 / JCM 8866 / NBRC 14739 / NCIMB 2177 / R-4) TaxID=523841 RepID=I3RAU6_HALMT|nr:hypothetical protein HFX_6233 [Haloferax mediterranei ATCC 33500]